MGRLSGLDALRGIAACIVFAFHIGANFEMPKLFPKGYLAVDFFFMLSGYVLARTYDARFAEDLSPSKFLNFRLRRLWPTMALATLLAVPGLLTYPTEVRWLVLGASLLFVPLIVGRDIFPLNGPQWSIVFELFANVIHAVVLHRLSVRALVAIVIVAAAANTGIAAWAGTLDVSGGLKQIPISCARVMMSYTLGIVLWRTWRDSPPFQVSTWIAFGILPLTAGVFGALAPAAWPIDIIFVLVGCPVIVAGGLSVEGGRFGSLLGSLSFPLYAFHAPCMSIVKALGASWLFSIPLAFAAAFAMHLYAASSARKRRVAAIPPPICNPSEPAL